jgi:predicted Rossmann fold nucleotide-binding protein DprA/Smf involved in DNA uptake
VRIDVSKFEGAFREMADDVNKMVESYIDTVDDILNVLGPMRHSVLLPGMEKPMRHPNEVSLNDVEYAVLQHVGTTETSLDSMVTASGLEPQQVLAALSVLEHKQIVRQISPTTFVRM